MKRKAKTPFDSQPRKAPQSPYDLTVKQGSNAENSCKELLRRVVRAFHGDGETVVLELLLTKGEKYGYTMQQIACMIHLDLKQVKNYLGELVSFGLLCEHTMKNPTPHKRSNISVYYVDYELTVWSLKYRIWATLQSLKNQKNEAEQAQYICSNKADPICPNRQRPVSSLELVMDNRNEETGDFTCPLCGSSYEIYSEKQKELDQRLDLRTLFNKQMKDIQLCLIRCEEQISEQAELMEKEARKKAQEIEMKGSDSEDDEYEGRNLDVAQQSRDASHVLALQQEDLQREKMEKEKRDKMISDLSQEQMKFMQSPQDTDSRVLESRELKKAKVKVKGKSVPILEAEEMVHLMSEKEYDDFCNALDKLEQEI